MSTGNVVKVKVWGLRIKKMNCYLHLCVNVILQTVSLTWWKVLGQEDLAVSDVWSYVRRNFNRGHVQSGKPGKPKHVELTSQCYNYLSGNPTYCNETWAYSVLYDEQERFPLKNRKQRWLFQEVVQRFWMQRSVLFLPFGGTCRGKTWTLEFCFAQEPLSGNQTAYWW